MSTSRKPQVERVPLGNVQNGSFVGARGPGPAPPRSSDQLGVDFASLFGRPRGPLSIYFINTSRNVMDQPEEPRTATPIPRGQFAIKVSKNDARRTRGVKFRFSCKLTARFAIFTY